MKWILTVLFTALLIGVSESRAQPAQALRRDKLLQYLDAAGQVQPVTNSEEWEKRRASIVAAMQQIMGPLPGKEKRTALRPEIAEEVDCGSYIRRLVYLSPEPRSLTPAYVLIPKRAMDGTNTPAVLCLHPTDNDAGHKVVVGLTEKPNRNYAAELAERGFVTIAPAYPLLANYQPSLKPLGYQSGTMKAVWDNIRVLDYLETLPYVQKGKFGAIGHSLGGHNALFTAVFDPRIVAVVTSCGFDSFSDYMDGDIRGWTSERYMPALLDYEQPPFDFFEVLGAIAPRAVFVSAPFYDSNFKWRSVWRIEEEVAKVFGLLGASERVFFEYPRCAHDFPPEMREKAYEWIARWVGKPEESVSANE